MSDPVLVTGATGTQGGAVARTLLKRGYRVRALTRDPNRPPAKLLAELGAEVVAGDFDDPASLRRAAEGTSVVYAMGTFAAGTDVETRQGIALVDAAHQAGTGHIIYSSVASALDHTGIPHFESKAKVEQHLATLATPATVLAPVAFLENVLAPWSVAGLTEGRYGSILPLDTPLQYVAIADLAEFAALVVAQPGRFAGQRIELASVAVTADELARGLSRWLGREVQAFELPLDGADDDMRAMVEYLRKHGYHVDIDGLRSAYPEVAWHTLESWAAEQDWRQLIP
ncbi:MAG TPA: NmrA/HSCARG family protein [Natronosporangium sp.]